MLLGGVLAGWLFGAPQAVAEMPAIHQKVITRRLAVRPDLRLLADVDCDCADDADGIAEWLGHPNHPYYAIGDFNHDGSPDFAVAVVSRRRPERRLIAVFDGPFSGAAKSPTFVFPIDGRDVPVVNPNGGPHLLVGPPAIDIGWELVRRPLRGGTLPGWLAAASRIG